MNYTGDEFIMLTTSALVDFATQHDARFFSEVSVREVAVLLQHLPSGDVGQVLANEGIQFDLSSYDFVKEDWVSFVELVYDLVSKVTNLYGSDLLEDLTVFHKFCDVAPQYALVASPLVSSAYEIFDRLTKAPDYFEFLYAVNEALTAMHHGGNLAEEYMDWDEDYLEDLETVRANGLQVFPSSELQQAYKKVSGLSLVDFY